MQTAINLIQTPVQELSATITDAAGYRRIVGISLRTMKDGSLIADITVDGEVQRYGVRCIDKMPLLLNNALNGNLYFYDTLGNTDPVYSGFNDRYLLIFDTEYSLV